MSSRPRKYINKLNIIEYWKNKIDECELNFDWSDAHEVCWACGDNVETEKCHIIPHCFDGDEIPENMILLCNQCHKENPNAISYDSYIQWLKSRKKIADKAFGVYWSGRAMIEYKNIYGSDFDVDLKTTDIDIETYIKIVNYVKGHFKMYKGPHRRNPVNTALLLREIFIKCNDKKFREQIKTQNEVFDREYEKELEENIDNELKELKNKRVKLIIKS